MTTLTEASRQPQTGEHRFQAYDAVRVVLALLLLAAAGLKGYALATGPVAEEGLLTSRWFLIAVVEGELLLGLWLVSGLWAKAGWGVALACFGGFAVVSLYKASIGEGSCGCFGQAQVSPWFMLGLDIAAITALVLFRPGIQSASPDSARRWRFASATVLALLIGVPGGLAMGSYRPATVDDVADSVVDGGLVVLEPETWVGQQFPLLPHIDIGEQLSKGEWLVVLYRHDCPHCIQMLPLYQRQAHEWRENQANKRVALIEMPPYAPSEQTLQIADSPIVRGQLNKRHDWFAQTPVEVELTNGIASGCVEGASESNTLSTRSRPKEESERLLASGDYASLFTEALLPPNQTEVSLLPLGRLDEQVKAWHELSQAAQCCVAAHNAACCPIEAATARQLMLLIPTLAPIELEGHTDEGKSRLPKPAHGNPKSRISCQHKSFWTHLRNTLWGHQQNTRDNFLRQIPALVFSTRSAEARAVAL